jgi:predicted DNA-binding transcriptional regulator YafY
MPGSNPKPVTFTYKNWQGKVATRRVFPLELWYGKTDYHPGEQWFLKAFDMDKHEVRDFAMADVSDWQPIQ